MKKLFLIWFSILVLTAVCSGQNVLKTTAGNHRVFVSPVQRNAGPGWHTDTSKVLILLTDSTFENGFRVTTAYRTVRGAVINNSSTLYSGKWIAIKPEDVYDVGPSRSQ